MVERGRREPILTLCDILQHELGLDSNRVMIYHQRFELPTDSGLFIGFKTCVNPKSENMHYGERKLDEEVCSFDEFEEVDIG